MLVYLLSLMNTQSYLSVNLTCQFPPQFALLRQLLPPLVTLDLSIFCNSRLMTVAKYDILQNLFKEFPNVMPTEERPIGKTTLLQHSITLEPDAKPLYILSYRIPHLKRQALEKEVKAMLEMNLIWPSNSPWASPLLVPKKDNTLGPVADYRKLNKVTVLEPFPIPNLRLLLQDIGSNNSLFNNRPCQGIPAGPYGIR